MGNSSRGSITINGTTQYLRFMDFNPINQIKKASVPDDVKRIVISSSFGNVSILSSAIAKEVEARLFSEGTFAGNAELQIEKLKSDLQIKSSFSGIAKNGSLKLEVIIPEKHFANAIANP